MINCPRCEGFVPPSTSACPNCDTTITRRWLRQAAKAVVGAATAMTLMACYGGGWDEYPEPYVQCNDGTSGVDNDGDGYCSDVDCNDNDSYRYDNCPSPGCIDFDGDGWCSDEDCNDNNSSIGPDCGCIDLDGDGYCSTEDCDDGDASLWHTCETICDAATTLEDLTEPTADTTADAPDAASTCGGGDADRVYAFTVTGEPGVLQYVTAEVAAETPHYLAARDACEDATDIACATETPHVELLAAPGETYWLIVEAASLSDRGDFSLSVAIDPLVCGDGQQVGPEQCDDGNQEPGDGCDDLCQLEGENP